MKRLVSLIAVLACGCVAAIPYEIVKDADRNVSFEDIKKDPNALAGKKVVLGGEIIETRALKEGTQIEVLQKPLDYYDVPYLTDESSGRFLVVFKEFLDPQVFRSGRLVTVVGEVKGKKTLPLGGTEYTYPYLEGRHIQLWAQREDYYPHFHFGIGVYRGYPYYW